MWMRARKWSRKRIKLPPSSLRDATSLTEGGSGEKEKCSILPKAPSLRELAKPQGFD